MPRCRIEVSNPEYTLDIRNVVRGFMLREYKTTYPIEVDRKHGTLHFELPYRSFNGHYSKLTAQLKNGHMNSHLKRAKLELSIV